MATIEEKAIYPPIGHPIGYAFDISKGRILNEYQLLNITEGQGIFENIHATFRVSAGSMIVLFSGE